jgi:hypothetical protein
MTWMSDQDAGVDWGHARRELLLKEVVCFFKGCSVDLQSFEEVRKSKDLTCYVDRGLLEIPLDNIRGSVGRYRDFSETFLPRNDHMRERWEQVDVAMRQGKTPPIEVYQVGETYYVMDGNHRVSIAKQRRMDTIAAYVMEFTQEENIDDPRDFEEALILREGAAFLEQVGAENQKKARAIVLTCAGCYQTLADQIETYRQGYEASWYQPMTYAEAFAAWHKEVYAPAVNAIRENDLLVRLPQRTEGDLFVWTWQNNQSLEALSDSDLSTPAS